MNIPKLRFREFNNEWKSKRLNEVTNYVDYRGKTPTKTETGTLLVTAKNIKKGFIDYSTSKEYIATEEYEEVMRRGAPLKGDVLFTTEAPMGNVAQVDKENIALAQRVIKFRGKCNLDNGYLKHYMLGNKFQNKLISKAIGTTVLGIQGKVLHKMEIPIPPLPEQEKIASFLSSVDSKIEKLEKKKELLGEYKKGVMQKVFSQDIRFSDENGKEYPQWEDKKLGDVASRITKKNKELNQNVMTISAQQGLISQLKFFNKSVAGKDLSNYILLGKNQFAYNKSYSKGYPMGAIKRLKRYDKGIVSSLYICFETNNYILDSFLEQYIEAGNFNKKIHKIAQEGARNHGLLNVSTSEFFKDIHIELPCLEEQEKIASFLSSLDKKIEIVEKEIEKNKKFKKGLLQQMFV